MSTRPLTPVHGLAEATEIDAKLRRLAAALADERDVALVDEAASSIGILLVKLRREAGLCAGGALLATDAAPWDCPASAVTKIERDGCTYELCTGCAARVGGGASA